MQDGVRRLLPDRRGLHQLGARTTASRSARAAARAPARWSRTRSASPTSIRCAYDLLFERFLNPERVSMPDFDIDFCMDGRDRVIDYVAAKVRPRPRQRRSSPTARWRRRPWCATSAACSGMPLRLRRQHRQADPVRRSGITLDDALGDRAARRSRNSRRRADQRNDRGRRARPARPGAAARRPDAQRRQARRRRRDRAVGAHRLRAAVLRRQAATASSRSSTRTTSRRPAW